MVIVALKEGLGNQLFQYFFAKGYEQSKIVFDKSFYTNGKGGTAKRSFDLNKFTKLRVTPYDGEAIEVQYIKDDFEYIGDKILNINENYYFDGYWHNKKYLQKVDYLIQKELTPDDIIKKYLFDKYNFLKNEECISIHVRRLDYLNLFSFYHQLDLNYYNNALDIIGRDKKIVLFSDDIEWCKENFKIKNIEFINESNHIDLLAMSLCSHNIIANSTFSFWGAYLNNNKQKLVVCPKAWYTQEYSLMISNFKNEDCASDLILDSWNRI